MNTPEPNRSGAPAWPDTATRAGGGAAPGDGSGEAGLAAALSVLGGLPDLPVGEHAAVYDGLHEALLQALDADADLSDTASDNVGSNSAGPNTAVGEA
ncbi:hypothetical protein GCM10023081_19510 [Arthrobacter ginkgonis]|uniref:Uncharacterized protein n=1 Tax=Arthrobacter ginkgonis TaxID=1630594 RepID=A0ABP7C862_9MICC